MIRDIDRASAPEQTAFLREQIHALAAWDDIGGAALTVAQDTLRGVLDLIEQREAGADRSLSTAQVRRVLLTHLSEVQA